MLFDVICSSDLVIIKMHLVSIHYYLDRKQMTSIVIYYWTIYSFNALVRNHFSFSFCIIKYNVCNIISLISYKTLSNLRSKKQCNLMRLTHKTIHLCLFLCVFEMNYIHVSVTFNSTWDYTALVYLLFPTYYQHSKT